MTDPDIRMFVESIGATEPLAGTSSAMMFRKLFRRKNYFSINGHFLIVKISRIEPPFWGVGKAYIDFLNDLTDYSLVLLTSPTEGWVFSKKQVNNHIASGKWALRVADGNYKIHVPLPDVNSFSSPARFLSMVGV